MAKVCAQLLNSVIQPLLNNLASFLASLEDGSEVGRGEPEDGITASPPIQTAEFGQSVASAHIEREMEVLEVRQMPDGVIGLCCEEKSNGTFVKVALREGKTYELTGKLMKVQMRPVFGHGEYLRLINYVYKPAPDGKAMGCYQTYLFTRSPNRHQPIRLGAKAGRISLGFSLENVDPRHFLDTTPEAAGRSSATIIHKSDTKSPLKNVGVQGSLNISSLSRNSPLGITRAVPGEANELGLTAVTSRPYSKCEKKRRMNCVCCSDALEGCSDLIQAYGKHKSFNDDHTPEGYWDLHFMETQKER